MSKLPLSTSFCSILTKVFDHLKLSWEKHNGCLFHLANPKLSHFSVIICVFQQMLLILRYTSRQHLQIRYLVPITLKSKSELYVPEHQLLSHVSMTAVTFPLTTANPFPPIHSSSEYCYKDLDLSLQTQGTLFLSSPLQPVFTARNQPCYTSRSVCSSSQTGLFSLGRSLLLAQNNLILLFQLFLQSTPLLGCH